MDIDFSVLVFRFAWNMIEFAETFALAVLKSMGTELMWIDMYYCTSVPKYWNYEKLTCNDDIPPHAFKKLPSSISLRSGADGEWSELNMSMCPS